MKLSDLEATLSALSPAEKARIIQMLAFQVAGACAGVEKTPGVAGGSACIGRTRIPVWLLEG